MALVTAKAKRENAAAALRRLADLVYPPLCPTCTAPVAATGYLCAACWAGLNFLAGPCCGACGVPFDIDVGDDALCGACLAEPPTYERARAVLRYDEAARGVLLPFKHGDRLDFVPTFGDWLARVGREAKFDADLVAPVPLHRWRLFKRRYNQSALIALALGQRLNLPVRPDLLLRTRATPSQGGLNRAERRRNVDGVFAMKASYTDMVKGRRVLIIDDVMTTGATVDGCAKTLKRAGAAAVFVLAVARAPLD